MKKIIAIFTLILSISILSLSILATPNNDLPISKFDSLITDDLSNSNFKNLDLSGQDFSGKDTQNISIVAKKWVRISQYETNSKKGKKIMDKLKTDFETKALELCSSKGNYNVLEKRIEILEIDETPAYGLETKLKIGINGVVECK